jgi:TatD DNase family protein
MQYIDTHCHIHDTKFFNALEAEQALDQAIMAGVSKVILVGTSLEDSKRAVAFADRYPKHCFASIGIHPHEAAKMSEPEIDKALIELAQLAFEPKVVAIGECGFDFYYNKKSEHLAGQDQLLRGQLAIARDSSLPVCFHVRDAFDEFWQVFKQYEGITGVLHSFTDTAKNLNTGLSYGLKIGVNGIATFTTKDWQINLFKTLNLADFVLETDAPFLTPKPRRGTINTPENVIYITDFMAELRGETKETIAKATTATATKLFNLT